MKGTVQEVAGWNLSQMTGTNGGKFVISLKPSRPGPSTSTNSVKQSSLENRTS